jgi:hypothetical protein
LGHFFEAREVEFFGFEGFGGGSCSIFFHCAPKMGNELQIGEKNF